MGPETESRIKLCACADIPSWPPNFLLSPQTRKHSGHVKLQTVTSQIAQKDVKSTHCWTEGKFPGKAVGTCFYGLTSGTACLIRINAPSSWKWERSRHNLSDPRAEEKRGSSLLTSILSPTHHLLALEKSTTIFKRTCLEIWAFLPYLQLSKFL